MKVIGKNKIQSLKSENKLIDSVLIIVFTCLLIFNHIFLSFATSSKIEVLSNYLSSLAMNHSQTLSVNLNIKSNELLTREKALDNIKLANDLSYAQKKFSPFYNARLSFMPNDNNYLFSSWFKEEKPTFILTNSFSNHRNSLNEIVDDVFELKLMFENEINYSNDQKNLCYIRQNDADYIISQNDIYLDYSALIGETIFLNYHEGNNNFPIEKTIINIVEEDQGIDKFLFNIYGSYAIIDSFLPSYLGLSFDVDFSNSILKNNELLEMLFTKYCLDDFSYQINTRNLTVENFDNFYTYLTNMDFNGDFINSNIFHLIIIFVLFLIYAVFLIVFIKKRKATYKCHLLFQPIVFSIIYLVFFIITQASVSLAHIFSLLSIAANLCFALLLILFMWGAMYIEKTILRKKEIKNVR